MEILFKCLSKLAVLAPLGTFIVATLALCFAYFQIKIAKQNEAKRQFLNYLDVAVAYPLLGHGNIEFDKNFLSKQYFEELISVESKSEDRIRYIWIRAKLFQSCESLLDAFPNDVTWQAVVKANIYNHLKNTNEYELDFYSKQFGKIFRQVISEKFSTNSNIEK